MSRNRVHVLVDPEVRKFVKESNANKEESFNTILRRMLGLPALPETRGRPKNKKQRSA